MADASNNTNDDSDAANAGLSPWEEDLLEEPKREEDKPQVVGSLEPEPDGAADTVKPVPFNIPENIEEKVGTKVPAEKFIEKPPAKDQKPIATPPVYRTPLTSQSETIASSTAQPAKVPTAPVSQPQPKVIPPKSVPIEPVSGVVTEDNKPLIKNQPAGGESDLITPIAPVTSANIAASPVGTPPAPGTIDSIRPAKDPFANVDLEQPTVENHSPEEGSQLNREPAPKTQNAQPDTQVSKNQQPQRKPILAKFKIPVTVWYVVASLLLLSALVYLTELGIVSFGLEKVYGLVRLEALWGGLPRNPEKALAMSAVKMKDNLDFKASGTITLTVNKTIESDITTPLVSMMEIPMAFVDSNAMNGIKAELATESYYDDYYDDVSVDDSATSDASSSQSSSDSESTSSGSDSTTTQSQDAGAGYETTEPTIKELSGEFNLVSSKSAMETDITVKKIVGKNSNISLLSSDGDLFVKSADIKFNQKSEDQKWLKYSIPTLSEATPIGDIMNIKTDGGFTIIGKRAANEKVSDTRCYKYLLSEIELGDALGSTGITGDMIQSMNGSVWIGVKDHLIHKISLTIVPSVSASVSRIDFEMEFKEYGNQNEITVPSLTDIIDLSGASPSVTAAAGIGESLSGDDKRKSDLATVKSALDAYKTKVGSYPISQSLDKLNSTSSIIKASLVPDYINTLPTDPKDSSGWYYAYKSDGKTFSLSARLEDISDPGAKRSGDIYLYYLTN